MQNLRWIVLTASVLVVLVAAAGCGQFFPSSTSITALQVAPSNATVAPGVTQQYTATATYGNMSTADVSNSVTWSTSQTSTATISSTGLLTGVALGTAIVKAQSGNIIGSTGITVANQTITRLDISPLTQTLSLSTAPTVQFTAIATYKDNSTANVTAVATWTAVASPSGAVTISNTSPSNGLATAVATGTATVSATAGGVTSGSSATITVGP